MTAPVISMSSTSVGERNTFPGLGKITCNICQRPTVDHPIGPCRFEPFDYDGDDPYDRPSGRGRGPRRRK